MSRTDDFRAVLNGTMTHAEYEAKWPPVTADDIRAAHERTARANRRIDRWEAARARRRGRRARARNS